MEAVVFEPVYSHWRKEARQLLQRGVPPSHVWWQPIGTATTHNLGQQGLDLGDVGSEPLFYNPVIQPKASKSFISVSERVACHRRQDRWAALYELLWRMNHGEPQLLLLASDPLVKNIHAMAKNINRDMHKMKAFVRFKTAEEGGFEEPRYVAWFEPEHYILTLVAPFFIQRFTNMRWSILTPDGCVHWEGRQSSVAESLWFSAGVDKSAAPADDEFDEAWKLYYRSIFNPARLKVQAMQSEMPQKYWKNLPEAAMIGELIQTAQQSMGKMLEAKPNTVDLKCGPRPK